MIEQYITNYLKEKLNNKGSLVIYDPDSFFHDLVAGMASDDLKVFDTTENVVTVREEALKLWTDTLNINKNQGMLVYVPFAKPIDEDDKVKDPFIIFSAGGSVFPDEATDSYKNLCLAALPEKTEKINALFEQEKYPSFDTINALVDGNLYPKLKSLLNVSSDTEILLAFLNPTEEQKKILASDKTWSNEFRLYLKTALGISTKARNLDSLQKDIWRTVLFSEFVYDLPFEIPAKLSEVQKVKPSAAALVNQACKQLRNHKDAEEVYVHHAKAISKELKLPELFKSEDDLGKINTFAFEDSTFFNQFASALINNDLKKAGSIVKRCTQSIWATYDDERRGSWNIANQVVQLLYEIKKQKELLKKSDSLQKLVEVYADKMYQVDGLLRHFEKEVQDVVVLNKTLKQVCDYARKNYFSFVEDVQGRFIEHIQSDGLSSLTIKRNTEVFDSVIAPKIKSGKKTVYILADAMRYELAHELSERLKRANFVCEMQPTLAYIPTVTKYGMAALLPEASKKLKLKTVDGNLLPFFDDKQIDQRKDRIKYTESLYGDQIAWVKTEDVIKGSFDKEKELLFVTTTEVDEAGENMPDSAQMRIAEVIVRVLKSCVVLKEAGFKEFVLVADHGFVLKDSFQPGDNTSRPIGDWVLRKTRSVAGKGDSNDDHIALTAEEIGVKADVDRFLFLKGYTTYDKGKKYFHEGISLQEVINPLLTFKPEQVKESNDIQVNLSYKGKDSGFITTRRPKLELATFGETLFGDPIDILIEAYSGNKLVGEAASSSEVNSTTKYVEVIPGQSLRITLAMDDDYEGEFKVIAKDPATGVILSEINLETDYL